MPNNFFKFKQFTIHQDGCAMKVTTLACIQGSWLAEYIPEKVLDIGAGTGLLSLMIAQKYPSIIDAVEIDSNATNQLKRNINESPWKDRINYHHNNIKIFAKHCSNSYDFIIANPPFFENQLKSPNIQINRARHESELTIKELLNISTTLLTPQGKLSILLPPAETEKMIEIGRNNSLFICDQLVISDTTHKPPIGIVTILSRMQSIPKPKNLIIKSEEGEYTQDFILLLKDYYLYL